MSATENDKRALRQRLRQAMAGLSSERLAAGSHAAAENLVSLPAFQEATALMLFLPLRGEIDARAIALRAWQRGITVTVPLVSYEQKHMIPVIVNSLEEPMDIDRFGVRTPRRAEPMPLELIDLVVVPGLGFDLAGRRIGRGGGFYDRFLSNPAFHGTTVGMALEEQLVDDVPTLGHDMHLDMLVTDRRIIRFDPAATAE